MKENKKYTYEIIFIIISAFLVFNIVFINQIVEEQKKKFIEYGEIITTLSSEALTHWIQDQIRVANTIAKNKNIIDVCRFPENPDFIQNAEEFLEHIHGLYPYYENIPLAVRLEKPIVREINGQKTEIKNGEFLIDSVDSLTVGKGGFDFSYIGEIFGGKTYYVSEIYPSILRDNPVFAISVPVEYDSEVIGAAIILPQMSYFTDQFVDRFKIEESGYMFFMDDRYQVIAHRDREVILTDDENIVNASKILVNKAKNDEHFIIADVYEAKKYYYVQSVDLPSENTENDWYITVAQTEAEITRRVRQLSIIIVIISIIIAVSTIVFLGIISNNRHKEIRKQELERMNTKLEGEIAERTSELKKSASIDGLTKLLNYKAAYEKTNRLLEDALFTNEKVVLMIADLDHFKDVNDRYGHLTGNEVLETVAEKISSEVRNDDIVGRFGGEEFIIVLKNTNNDFAYRKAESIRKKIEETRFSIKGLSVTISIGACEWNRESLNGLIKKADDAMYAAKLKGRNRVEMCGS